MPKEKILKDIKRYINLIPNKEDRKLYYAMIDLINGKNIEIDFDKLFDELDKDSNKKFEPNKIRNYVAPINDILNNIENNADEDFKINKNEYKYKSLKKINRNTNSNSNIFLYAIIGKKGNLFRIKQNSNYFTFKNNNFEREIILNSSLKNGQRLYECKIISNNYSFQGYIYFFSGNFNLNGFSCILFDDEP